MPTPPVDKLVDPNLTEALRHWSEFSEENRQNALILFNAITPIKDKIQVTGQLLEAIQHTDWLQTTAKLADPSALVQSFSELADIQIATLGKLQESYNAFLKTTQACGEQLSGVSQGADSAQALLASYLETSLNIVKQYQADATDEASSLNVIQSAYNAWFQKTLQSLSTQ